MPTVNDPSGHPMTVNEEGRALTYSVTESEGTHVNGTEGGSYTAVVDITTDNTNNDFFYIQNTDTRQMVVLQIDGWSDDANQIISVNLGGTDAGTEAGDAIIPANLNAGSGNSADIVCVQDATDLAITGGRIVRKFKLPVTPLQRDVLAFCCGLVIPKNQRMHFSAALAGAINLNVTFFFHD